MHILLAAIAVWFHGGIANAVTMEMTHVTGIHIEKLMESGDALAWLVQVDSDGAGRFSGALCTSTEEGNVQAAAVIQKASQENQPLDLILNIDRNSICLLAVRVSEP